MLKIKPQTDNSCRLCVKIVYEKNDDKDSSNSVYGFGY